MSSLLLALSPFVVTGLTSLLKRIPQVSNLSETKRVAAIRFIVAILSLVSASLVFMLGGDPVGSTSVEEASLAFITFLSALGGHDLLKLKK